MLEMAVADGIWFRSKFLKLSWLSHNSTQKSKGNGGAQDDSRKVNAVGDVQQPNPATTARMRRAARGMYPETQ